MPLSVRDASCSRYVYYPYCYPRAILADLSRISRQVFANVRTHYKIPHPEGYLEELGTDDKDSKDKDGDDAEPGADKE